MKFVSRRTVLTGALAATTRFVGACGGDPDDSSVPAPETPPTTTPPPPSWVAQARQGTWVEVPVSTTLDSVDPIKSPAINPNYPNTPEWSENTTRQGNVVKAWCGAAYDEATDTMWLGLGGGHRDYAGNEVYRCGFHAESPAWQMVRKPSGSIGNLLRTNDGLEARGIYSDGRPRATHTYNKWVYVPGVGPVLMGHGGGSWTAAGGKRWAVFVDERTGEHSFSVEATSMQVHETDGAGACYDPLRNAMWFGCRGNSAMVRYNIPKNGDPQRGTYEAVGPQIGKSGELSMCYLPEHDCLLIGSNYDDRTNPQWHVFDCATGIRSQPAFVGTLPGSLGPGMTQLRWAPTLGAVCAWDNATETRLITRVTPGANPRTDAWAINTLPIAATNAVVPTARTPNGTYGRFAFAPRLGGFLVFNETNGPTHFYKL